MRCYTCHCFVRSVWGSIPGLKESCDWYVVEKMPSWSARPVCTKCIRRLNVCYEQWSLQSACPHFIHAILTCKKTFLYTFKSNKSDVTPCSKHFFPLATPVCVAIAFQWGHWILLVNRFYCILFDNFFHIDLRILVNNVE